MCYQLQPAVLASISTIEGAMLTAAEHRTLAYLSDMAKSDQSYGVSDCLPILSEGSSEGLVTDGQQEFHMQIQLMKALPDAVDAIGLHES